MPENASGVLWLDFVPKNPPMLCTAVTLGKKRWTLPLPGYGILGRVGTSSVTPSPARRYNGMQSRVRLPLRKASAPIGVDPISKAAMILDGSPHFDGVAPNTGPMFCVATAPVPHESRHPNDSLEIVGVALAIYMTVLPFYPQFHSPESLHVHEYDIAGGS